MQHTHLLRELLVPRNHSLTKFSKLLNEAVIEAQWAKVGVARQRLVQLMLRALKHGAFSQIQSVGTVLNNAHSMALLNHDIDPEPNPSAQAWMLYASAEAANFALRLVSRPAALLDEKDANVPDQILVVLFESNQPWLTNGEVADRIHRSESLISKALTALAAQGLVQREDFGRTRRNSIASEGRTRVEALLLYSSGVQDYQQRVEDIERFVGFRDRNAPDNNPSYN